MKKFVNIFLQSFREKIMTVPRKKTQRDLRRMEKAEKAALVDKVIFSDNHLQVSTINCHILTCCCYDAEYYK